jgi:hypothetical protein
MAPFLLLGSSSIANDDKKKRIFEKKGGAQSLSACIMQHHVFGVLFLSS